MSLTSGKIGQYRADHREKQPNFHIKNFLKRLIGGLALCRGVGAKEEQAQDFSLTSAAREYYRKYHLKCP